MYQSLFGPAYLALVDCLMTKSMMSIDQSEWSPDDKETFRCYRQVTSKFYPLKNDSEITPKLFAGKSRILLTLWRTATNFSDRQ